jgi:hypothetical protein
MTTNRYPLAHDMNGNPIEIPAEAVGWRVRRRSGKAGRPQCVYDFETGAQLDLRLDATIDDLRDYGPGVYRLDAIDREGRVIPDVIAQTEVPFEAPVQEQADEPYGTRHEAASLVRHLVEANVRVMEALASAFGQVRPAEVAPVVVSEQATAGKSTQEQIAQLMQMAPAIAQTLKQLWGNSNGTQG